jgi:hypothetical protein
MHTMAQNTYDVIIQADGRYAVTIRKPGALAQTATGFTTETEARAWVDMDRRLDDADNPFRERDPSLLRVPAWRTHIKNAGEA